MSEKETHLKENENRIDEHKWINPSYNRKIRYRFYTPLNTI